MWAEKLSLSAGAYSVVHYVFPGAGLLNTLYQLPVTIKGKQIFLTKGHTIPHIYIFFPKVAQTTDGIDADLWKDGLFKSKVTRYLCFTRVFSKENVSKVKALSVRKL